MGLMGQMMGGGRSIQCKWEVTSSTYRTTRNDREFDGPAPQQQFMGGMQQPQMGSSSLRWVCSSPRWVGSSPRWVCNSPRWVCNSLRWVCNSPRWVSSSSSDGYATASGGNASTRHCGYGFYNKDNLRWCDDGHGVAAAAASPAAAAAAAAAVRESESFLRRVKLIFLIYSGLFLKN